MKISTLKTYFSPLWVKALLSLVLLYLLVALFVIPPILKEKATTILSQSFHQKVELHSVRINPITLSITIRKLTLYEQQTPLFSVEKASLRLGLAALLFKQDITIKKCVIFQPQVQLLIYNDTTFNVANFLKPLTSSPDQATTDTTIPSEPSSPQSPPTITIKKFSLVNGQISFDDKTAQQKEPLRLTDISFSIDDFSTDQTKDSLNVIALDIITGLGAHIKIATTVALNPLEVRGDITLENVNLQFIQNAFGSYLPFNINSGLLNLQSHFSLNQQSIEGKPPVVFSLSNGDALLQNLVIADTLHHTPVISIDSLKVVGTQLNTGAPFLKAKSISLVGDSVIFSLNESGEISFKSLTNFDQLIEAYPALKKLGGKFQFYSMKLDEIHLSQQKVAYIDSTFLPPVHHALTGITIILDNMVKEPVGVSAPADSVFHFTYQSRYNKTGEITVVGKGTLVPFSLFADIDANNLRITSIQSYLATILNIHIKHGRLSASLSLDYPQHSTHPLRLTGSAKVENLIALNGLNNGSFFKVPAIELHRATLQPKPLSIHAQNIHLKDPYVYTHISTDGLTNIVEMHKTRVPRLIKRNPKKAKALISFDTITVANFTADMNDSSVLFGFTSTFKKLNGTITGFKTNHTAKLVYHLAGVLDTNTTIMLDGMAQPFQKHPVFAFNLLGQGINLPSFSPYSSTFAGLPIKYGQLKVDLKYYIAHDSIWGDNNLIIDNVVFGDDILSKRAIDAPFRLGFKILNNSDGVTTLNAHVEGSLSDPNFKLGNIIWEGIGRAVGKAASTPFRAMARASKAKKINEVYFVEGTDRITGPGQQKIEEIAEIMNTRDDFNVQIYGVINPKSELFFIKQQKLINHLKNKYHIENLTVEAITNRPDRKILIKAYDETLQKSWKEDFEEYSNRKLKKYKGGNRVVEKEKLRVAYAKETLDQLTEIAELTDEDIRAFRRKRATAVHHMLTKKYAVDPKRFTIVDSLKDEPKNGTYTFLKVVLPANTKVKK